MILEKSHIISPHIYNFCRESQDTVFTKEIDIKIWSKCKYNVSIFYLIASYIFLSDNELSMCDGCQKNI